MPLKNYHTYVATTIFSIFLGSQITEGFLLVPHWQSLSTEEFYAYYQQYGPKIGLYFTVLTILASLQPIGFSIYYYKTKSRGLPYAIVSSILAMIVIAFFYLYFKGCNELFYDGSLNESDLNSTLITWKQIHWIRVFIEGFALIFLILAILKDKKAA